MSLYLKYRPQTFDDITWQKHIVDILKKQVQLWQTMHNYLFFWPRWTWKTTTARILAKAVNCQNLKDWNPCNECENCKAINTNQTIDFVEIDAASHTQVDNIREEIIDKAPYPPTQLKKKVYIIDEVHMLSKAAFNALLKIMEEPPEYLMFILATTEINKVPDTIISRCQVFNFKRLSNKEIVDRLKYIAEKENIHYVESALYMIAQVSDGALRDAVKYLEQVSVLGEVNEENVIKFLWVAPDRQIRELLEFLKWLYNGKEDYLDKIFEFLEKLQLGWVDLQVFAKQVLNYIDKHFIEDIEFYPSIAELFKKIFISLKLYPTSLLAYKIEIANFLNYRKKYLNLDTNDTKKFEDKEKDNKIDSQESKISENVWNEILEKKKTTTDELKQHDDDFENYELKEKEEKIEEKIKKEETKQVEYKDINLDKLMLDVISKCNKISLKAILKRYASFEEFSDNVLTMVVINKIQYKLLTKEENVKYIENLVRQILWDDNIILHIEYMDKEEYMRKKLEQK